MEGCKGKEKGQGKQGRQSGQLSPALVVQMAGKGIDAEHFGLRRLTAGLLPC